jgi:hypothetical protein
MKSLPVYDYIKVLIWVYSEQKLLDVLVRTRFVSYVFYCTVRQRGNQSSENRLRFYQSVDKEMLRTTDLLCKAGREEPEYIHNLYQKLTDSGIEF